MTSMYFKEKLKDTDIIMWTIIVYVIPAPLNIFAFISVCRLWWPLWWLLFEYRLLFDILE